MFRGCSSVTELFNLDRLDTSNVENTSYMFLNCLTLKAVSILGWEASVYLHPRNRGAARVPEQNHRLHAARNLDPQPFLARIKIPVVSRNPPGTF